MQTRVFLKYFVRGCSPVQELAEDVFGEMVAFELEESIEHMNPIQA